MYRLLAYLLLLPLYLLSLLPLRVHYLFADLLNWLLGNVFKYRREVIDINLKGAFPDMPQVERDTIRRNYYKYLSDVVCEMVWAMTRSGSHILRKGFYRVDSESEKVINNSFGNSTSVVTLLAHTGNWEISSDLPHFMQKPAFGIKDMTAAYQTLHSPLSEQLFLLMRRKRLSSPDSLTASHRILRYMLEHRRQKRLYFFIADQYPYSGVAHSNTFLGLPTEWHNGGEVIARKLHLPVLYLYIDRVKRGEYVIKISQICSDASLCREGEITRAYSALLEKDILSRNENWLWSHRRWKNILNYKI